LPNEFTGAAAPLSADAFDSAVASLGIDAAALWAILTVETRGFGFLPDKRPKILFERHIFHKRTDGKFSARFPDISSAKAGGYSGGAAEYDRLSRAMALNRTAALESASWGLPQIMGFNAVKLKYDSAQDMIGKFLLGEDAQIEGAVRFIKASQPLLDAVRAGKWATVAFFYNGKDFKKNNYDTKLKQFNDLYSIAGHQPDIEIRASQARLLYLGFDPHGVDGATGQGTRAAALAFQKTKNGTLQPTGDLDDPTRAALKDAAGV
jgi:hypothetical protein